VPENVPQQGTKILSFNILAIRGPTMLASMSKVAQIIELSYLGSGSNDITAQVPGVS
jgi:hypothetical protein